MEFKDNANEAEFRAEVRVFVAEHWPGAGGQDDALETELDPLDRPAIEQWRRALATRGWIAPHWPVEYGGAGMTPGEQFILNEELALARIPDIGGLGVRMIGPTIIIHGSDEQKAEHLPPIASGEVVWCQGYSEPGAGSDLASLQTRAARQGDDYVINGQKIWSTYAHRADWMFMLVRTDPTAPKHRGISMLLVPMKTPGITIRPLIDLAGNHHFNQEYFEDVRVSVRNRVGEENMGWYVGATLLDFERSNINHAIELKHTVDALIRVAHTSLHDSRGRSLRNELSERYLEVEIAKLFSYRIISMQKRGLVPNHEASVNKIYRSEAQQRVGNTGMKLIQMRGLGHGDRASRAIERRISQLYLTSVARTIAGGSNEIQRNVIASRGLGLPKP